MGVILMQTYILLGKTSQSFATAMLNKPQNRRESVQPMLEAFGVEEIAFMFTNNPEFNFVGIIKAESDEVCEALVNVVFATDNFSKFVGNRAFDANYYQKVFELVQQNMASYVSSLKEAGLS